MKESTYKLKEKPVGADASVRPFFKRTPKDNKGITLIALIITIIVMMILVGVTVTFTIGENGILSQAKQSAKLAERAEIHEQIMGEMKLTNKGKIKIQETYDAAKATLEGQDYIVGELQEDGTFEVIGKKGTYKYKITETEIIIVEAPETPEETVPEALLDYIFGEKDETTGKRLGRESSEILNYGSSFKQESIPAELQDGNLTVITYVTVSDEIVEKADAEGNITYEAEENRDIYFTYEDTIYKFRARLTYIGGEWEGPTIAEVGMKDLSYDKTSKVGKHVWYDGIEWIVLYDDAENGLQMISKDVISVGFHLGKEDTSFTESEVTEIDGVAGKSDLEKTMYSYNNAVTTLNKVCEGLVTPKEGVIKGVRCVGSDPITPNEENSKAFIGSATTMPGKEAATWFEDNLNLQLNTTEERTYYTIKGTNPAQEYTIKDVDYNYEKDFDRMVALGICDSNESYWMASRFRTLNDESCAFFVRRYRSDLSYFDPLVLFATELYASWNYEGGAGSGIRTVITVVPGSEEYFEYFDPNPPPIETTTATVPTGFAYVMGTEGTGYVIENETEGSQFVWVPVSDINSMVMCKTCESSTNSLNTETAQCRKCGENTILVGKLYSDPIDRTSILSYNDPESEDYTAMAKSVAKYKGFYVGRYETSKSSSGIAQSKKSTETDVIVSANANTDGNWNGLKALCETYSTSSVQGKMIWGSQYDQMVAWIGNSSGLSSGYNTSSNPGTVDTDVINNIYDLYGNKYEGTQELNNGTGNPINRSGDNASGNRGLTARCTSWAATNTSKDLGARMILYITE